MSDREVFPGLGFEDEEGWLGNTQEYMDRMSRMMRNNEVEDEGQSTRDVTVPKMRGKHLGLVEVEEEEWSGTQEEQEDWTEVAISFLERSECATPRRTQEERNTTCHG